MSKKREYILKEKNMEEKELITKYLNAIYQNIRTAIQSIEDIEKKVEDDNFVSELSKQQDGYLVLAKECEGFAKAEKIEGIKDNNWMEKVRLWTSINMSTITDNSNRKIAELMLIGTFMGIISCIKDKSDHKGISKELDEILDRLYKFERNNIDRLLPYLE